MRKALSFHTPRCASPTNLHFPGVFLFRHCLLGHTPSRHRNSAVTSTALGVLKGAKMCSSSWRHYGISSAKEEIDRAMSSVFQYQIESFSRRLILCLCRNTRGKGHAMDNENGESDRVFRLRHEGFPKSHSVIHPSQKRKINLSTCVPFYLSSCVLSTFEHPYALVHLLPSSNHHKLDSVTISIPCPRRTPFPTPPPPFPASPSRAPPPRRRPDRRAGRGWTSGRSV